MIRELCGMNKAIIVWGIIEGYQYVDLAKHNTKMPHILI